MTVPLGANFYGGADGFQRFLAERFANTFTAGQHPNTRCSGAQCDECPPMLDGCACVVTVVVRGTAAELTEVADRADVRAVQALPPDVVSGKFAVEPLLPEYVDVVAPLPDDGDVPSR